MKKKFMMISLFLLSCDDIGVNNSNTIKDQSFVNAFGSNWYEYGWGLTQLNDGGFAITGRLEYKSSNTRDMVTIRTDENGNGIWQKSYGGNGNEEGYSVIQTQDGNILSVGFTWSYGNKQDIFVVKSDMSGRKIWQKNYGGTNREIGHKAISASDGNIMIIGQTNSPGISRGNDDIWLSKIDQDGNVKWRKAYGEKNHEVGYDIIELDDKGFFIVGYREFYELSGKGILIIKVDEEGNKIWEKIIETNGYFDEIAYSISKSKNYGYIICASTNASRHDWYDPQVINIDFDGNIIWNKIFNGSGLKHTRWSATSTQDGGAAIVGTTNYYRESGSNEDAYIIKINKDGNKVWDYSILGGKNDWGWNIIETVSDALVLVGSTKSYGNGLFNIMISRITQP